MPTPDRAWLEAHASMTIRQAALAWGCSEPTMSRHYSAAGVERVSHRPCVPGRGKLRAHISREWLEARLTWRAGDIAEELHCRTNTVYRLLAYHGLRLEPATRAKGQGTDCATCKARPLCRLLEPSGERLPCEMMDEWECMDRREATG